MNWDAIEKRDRIIVALDCDAEDALVLGERLAGHASWVKVGMTLYYQVGPAIVGAFHELGFKVFVDLKLHDIPHQVSGAAASLARAGADLLTVHASGGIEMMEAALSGVRLGAKDAVEGRLPVCPLVCGITVLTSMDSETLSRVGVFEQPADQVKRLALLTTAAGLDGVVCSPREANLMRGILGPDVAIITPGVRPVGADLGDQSRVATPQEAFAAGASHLVIGRPITRAGDPVEAFEGIVASL